MQTKTQKINIAGSVRSDKIKALIAHKPGFIERYAFLFFLLIFIIISATISIIKYPTILTAHGVLRIDNKANANGVAPSESLKCGIIFRLEKNNSNRLKSGQEIRMRVNSTKTSQLINAQGKIDSISTGLLNDTCFAFLTLSKEEIKQIKPGIEGITDNEAEIYFIVDNPTILQRLIRKIL